MEYYVRLNADIRMAWRIRHPADDSLQKLASKVPHSLIQEVTDPKLAAKDIQFAHILALGIHIGAPPLMEADGMISREWWLENKRR